MADSIGSMLSGVLSGSGSAFMTGLIVIGSVIVVLLIIGGIFALWFFKKRYNLKVEVKTIRSDGKIINGEWAKGIFNAGRGVVYIKRKGLRTVPMKVFDIRRYLQGSDLLTVIQVASEDYRPVINDSWTEHTVEYEDDAGKTYEQKESVLNIKVDSGLNKAWKSAWDNASKKAYSISTFFTQFQAPITIAIVLIAIFVGFAIIWNRLPSVCG